MSMSAELWAALGTIVATVAFLVIPVIVYAHRVLESWIADPESYESVIAAVENGQRDPSSVG